MKTTALIAAPESVAASVLVIPAFEKEKEDEMKESGNKCKTKLFFYAHTDEQS